MAKKKNTESINSATASNSMNQFGSIEVFGAREHNLKNLDISIPKNKNFEFYSYNKIEEVLAMKSY